VPGTNTVAYYEKSQHTDVKSFIILATGVNGTKLFSLVVDATDKQVRLFILGKPSLISTGQAERNH
jgi:hypothetical protein